MPRCWQAVTGLVWTRYDDSDDWVVFNPASGNVHLLTSSAHDLWELTLNRASTFEELVPALAERLSRPSDEDLTEASRAVLAFMDEAGLVRPLNP